jgi:eukaryotic-like serine/threonine-protein kinase
VARDDETATLGGMTETPATRRVDDERADPAAPLPTGTRIDRYTLRHLLGTGGMGDVYLALDPELDRPVALKLVRQDRLGPAARLRFLREAQTLAKLSHGNVVTVFDAGEHEGQVFIAMERLEGTTLQAWMTEQRRSAEEICDVFVAAGRGLAAAHKAGIIHRDFKPHNVIIGPTGVKVVDFGLAYLSDDSADEGITPAPKPSPEMTHSGVLLGTPVYMAPELFAYARATAASDQYSFAVSLYEALTGRRPFSGDSFDVLVERVRAGVPVPATGMPRRLARVIRRGLAREPRDRFPSMDAMLQALSHRRLPRFRALAVAAAVALAAAGAFVLGRKAAMPACDGGGAQAAALWNEPARTRIRDAFIRTGSAHAADTFVQVDASLRRRLAGWADAHRDACEATQIRHEQSEAMLDRRMRCLGQARSELAAVISLLGDVDAERIARATQAAGAVGDVVPCSDLVSLGATKLPPRDPAQAAGVEKVRQGLAQLSALRLLGKPAESLAAARDLLLRARELGDGSLVAQTLLAVANLEKASDADAAIDKLYEAARVAASAGDDPLGARAATDLVFALGWTKQRFESAEVAYRLAVAAAARAGNSPDVLARLYGHRARVLYMKGEYAAALPLYHLVLALREQLYGRDSLEVAMALMGLADTLSELGRADEARATYGSALAVAEQVGGPDHPEVLTILNNLGMALDKVGDDEGSTAVHERALAAKERIYPPDDLRIATGAHNLGLGRLRQGRIPEGRALIERGYRIRLLKLGPDHPFIASSYDGLAEADRREGKKDELHAYYEKALAIATRALGPEHPKVAYYLRLDASALLSQGRVADARAAIDRAIAIEEKTIGAAHPTHQQTLRVRDEIVKAETVSRR